MGIMMIAGTEHRRQGCSLQDGKQWGKTISGNNVKTKFPIAFTAFCMLSVSVNSSNGNAAESVFRNGFGYTNKTLSDWILRGPTSDATYFADYIAIGCQPQWGSSASLSGYVAVCIFPISFTTTDYTAVATGVMGAADATFGKENYVNNILWDFTSESQVAFRLSHLDRPTLKYIAIGF